MDRTRGEEVDSARREIVRACRSLFQRGLAGGSSGNISIRTGSVFLATPTGISFGDLEESDIPLLDESGFILSGKKPSKEMPFHLAWYRTNPGHHSVVHLHSPFATAISCLKGLDPGNAIPPLTPYQVMKIGRLPLLPYERPGSQSIADHIAGTASGMKAVLLSNHGPVCGGVNLKAALDTMDEVESTCRLFLLLGGRQVRFLTEDEVRDLAEGGSRDGNSSGLHCR